MPTLFTFAEMAGQCGYWHCLGTPPQSDRVVTAGEFDQYVNHNGHGYAANQCITYEDAEAAAVKVQEVPGPGGPGRLQPVV